MDPTPVPPRRPTPAPTSTTPPAPRRRRGRASGHAARVGLAIASALTVLLAASPSPVTGAPAGGGPALPWAWPTATEVGVLRPFDPPPEPWLAGHRGVDLDVAVGSEVLAPADGVVAFAGRVVDRPVVTVDHGPLRSSFEPVEALLPVGARVSRGEVLGRVVAGHSPGALHWGVRTGPDAYVDPLRLLVAAVVLKPWR